MKIARENLISGLVVIALGLVFLSQAFGLEQANATEGIHPMDYPKALTWLFIAVGCCIVLVPSHRRSDSDIPLFSARTAAVSGIPRRLRAVAGSHGIRRDELLRRLRHRLCNGVAQAAFAAAVEPVRNSRHLVAVLVCPQTPASDGHTVLEERAVFRTVAGRPPFGSTSAKRRRKHAFHRFPVGGSFAFYPRNEFRGRDARHDRGRAARSGVSGRHHDLPALHFRHDEHISHCPVARSLLRLHLRRFHFRRAHQYARNAPVRGHGF